MAENNDGMAYVILGVIVIIIVVVSLFFIFNKVVNSSGTQQNETTDTPKHFSIQAKNNYKLVYDVDYKLFNQGNLIQSGELKEGFVERINELRNNTNYTLVIDSNKYYEERVNCNSNQFFCIAHILKYPEIDLRMLKLEENYYRVFIYLKDGVLKNPALCVADNSFRIKTISVENDEDEELLEIRVPERLKLFYDKCYYPHTETQIASELRDNLEQEYDYNINKYNKEKGTDYDTFEQINFGLSEIQAQTSELWESGVHEFNYRYEIDTLYGFNQDSKLKLVLLDQYELSKYDDIDVSDEEYVVELYE